MPFYFYFIAGHRSYTYDCRQRFESWKILPFSIHTCYTFICFYCFYNPAEYRWINTLQLFLYGIRMFWRTIEWDSLEKLSFFHFKNLFFFFRFNDPSLSFLTFYAIKFSVNNEFLRFKWPEISSLRTIFS